MSSMVKRSVCFKLQLNESAVNRAGQVAAAVTADKWRMPAFPCCKLKPKERRSQLTTRTTSSLQCLTNYTIHIVDGK